ncbi:MAG TPA: fumarylacetoacetate hydrolase family protein, partial [Aggregatilineales bacterium]|nr:fumarylacetoacetate hydrolase family protein [Aggregatilineales bacterium]
LIAYAPCVGTPEKIICVGRNYIEHAKESGSEPPKHPILFSKFNNALTGHNSEVPLPPHAEQCDYEAELALIIGKEIKNVPEDEALDAVFGYTCANDISARDLQFLTPQWLIGKSPDRFLPLGPYLVTADEVKDPQNVNVKLWLNDDLRQDSNTRHMIFSLKTIISFASKHFTLKPGDVIITGTPEGVIMGREEKDWLKPGDEIAIEIGDLGRLSNTIIKGH